MKILMINTLYPPNIVGGAEISVKILAESLVDQGHDVSVLTLSPSNKKKIIRINGVLVYLIPLKNIYWPFKKNPLILRPAWHLIDIFNPFMGNTVKQIINIEKPDIINTHNLSGFSVSVWIAAKQSGIPLLHTLRDLYLLCPRSTMYHKNKNCNSQCLECRIASYYKKYKSDMVDGVVGISDFILNKHLHNGYFKNSTVRKIIPNSYAPLKQVVHQKSNVVRFGYLGRLHPSKGIETALSAFKQLKNEDYKFFIGGSGTKEYERKLKMKYQTPNIHFLGFIKPESLFEKIDVLVIPSLWNESFGRSIIEAFAHGIPVIGSNMGGIPELIDQGKTGYIFNSEDRNSLLDTLKEIINNPNIIYEIKDNTIKKSLEFLPETITSMYLNSYDELI